MAGRYCEGKIKMASEEVSRKMVLEIKYVNANNAVIHTENSKLLLTGILAKISLGFGTPLHDPLLISKISLVSQLGVAHLFDEFILLFSARVWLVRSVMEFSHYYIRLLFDVLCNLTTL